MPASAEGHWRWKGNTLKRKRSLAIGTVVALAFFGLAPIAVAGNGVCGSGEVCFFWDANYSGSVYDVVPPSGGVINIASNWNDKTSSWKNRSTYNARWYTNASGTGTCWSMLAGYQKATMADNWNHTAENDMLSSFATNGAC